MNAISPLNRTWNVPAYKPALPLRPKLGYDTDPKPAFIDSALVALLVDLGAAVPSGLLAYSFYKKSSSWSNFFWVVSALSSFKAMIDLSRIRTR